MQELFIGDTALLQMQNTLHESGIRNVFLVRGKLSYAQSGAGQALDRIMAEEDMTVSEWSDFQVNPKIEEAELGIQLLSESGAAAIIAVGGGSVLDMAKLIRFGYSYEGDLTGTDFTKRRSLLPLFALPTTAGTGCETTPFAVCYKGEVKYSVAHADMLPDYAIIYPPFTYSNSPYLTACAGFDAFAHAVESYWNRNATDDSKEYAFRAIDLLWKNLPLSVSSPTEEVRSAMAEGAYWAGRAIAITKTTAPHAFSYAFTTRCGYPHGHAVALTFPFFFEMNLKRDDALIGRLALNQSDSFCRQMKSFVEGLGLGNRGFKDADVDALLSKVNLQRLKNNPVEVSEENIRHLKEFLLQ